MFCSKCGHNLVGNQGMFCQNCGAAAGAQTPSAHGVAAVKPSGRRKLPLIIAAVVVIAAVAAVVVFFVVSNREHPIVGTWELVDIRAERGEDVSALDFMIGMRETFFPDGVGISYFPDAVDGADAVDGDRFFWEINGNRLLITWEFEWGSDSPNMLFEISGSTLTQIVIPDNPDSSSMTWTWRRIN
jgi:hypothetical protein